MGKQFCNIRMVLIFRLLCECSLGQAEKYLAHYQAGGWITHSQEIQHFYLTFVLFSTHLHSLEAFTSREEIFLSVIWGIIWGRIKLNTICYVCNTNLFCLNKEFLVLFHFLIIRFVGKEFSYQRNVSPLLQTQKPVSRKVWSSLF